ncbi:hypothetical protein BB560_000677 [Smittium megazygosporum]|uniref:DNA topoisomerase n=1 Tax=Smittium megazygosporum TaxID=133381 RepID=A0A2T9ZJR6_9FUNG|nr:hypothetical protein BB560_000677 [Smittium megazygosporum]
MDSVAKNLSNNARNSQFLYIWTDCDREGEHIGYEASIICKQANPRLIVKRSRYSAVQHNEINLAMNNPVELNFRQVEAVETRMELDFRIGVVLTRFQTLLLQRRFQAFQKKVISYGSCQFPTLGFVVDRYKKVKDFVPEGYHSIAMEHTASESEKASFKWKRFRVYDFETCFALYSNCMQDPTATITNVDSKEKLKYKPYPLRTVEMEKLGVRFLKMSPEKTMKVAEQLYNKGLISYPRTETDIFDPSTNLNALIQKHISDPLWGSFASKLVSGDGFQRPRAGRNNDKAHPPIHPTAHANLNKLSPDEKKLYEFIVRRFLACCSKDAVGYQTTVTAKIGGELFTTSGLMIRERNFLEIYKYGAGWNEQSIPVYTVNESFTPSRFEIQSSKTSAPNLLDEADLVDLMNKSQIGTDATIHEHIKKVQDREYVIKLDKAPNKGRFVPSNLGFALVDGYDMIGLDLSLSKPYLRGEMENLLIKICNSETDKQSVIEHCLALYRSIYMKTASERQLILDSISKHLDLAQSSQGNFSGTSNRNNFNASSSNGTHITDNQNSSNIVGKCPYCNSGDLLMTSTPNNEFKISCSEHNSGRCAFVLDIRNRDKKIDRVTLLVQKCNICSSRPRKILFVFKPGSVPPTISLSYEGCVFGCNQMLNEFLNIPQRSSSDLVAGRSQSNGSNVIEIDSFPNPQIHVDIDDYELDDIVSILDSENPLDGNFVNTTSKNNYNQVNSGVSVISEPNIPSSSTNIFERVKRAKFFKGGNNLQNQATTSDNTSDFFNSKPPLKNISLFNKLKNPRTKKKSTPENKTSNPKTNSSLAPPTCYCNIECVSKVVRKKGPNEGKNFWTCSLGRVNGCEFFEWVNN